MSLGQLKAVFSLRKTHLLMAFVLAFCMAYFFIYWHPHPKDDLFRYFAWLDVLRLDNMATVIHFVLSRGEFITMGYYWLIAQTGLYGLLQFFPTLISLFIIQYIAIDYAFRKKRPMWHAWIGIAFFLASYEIFMIPSGLRSTLAFSIFTLALYKDIILQRRSILLYLITPFIHLGSFIPLAVRLLITIKSVSVYIALGLVAAYFMLYPGGQVIHWLVGGEPTGFVAVNLYKLGNYLTPLFPVSLPYLYKIGKLVALLAIGLIVYRSKKVQTEYVKLYIVLAGLSLLCLGNYLLWYRLLEIILIGSPVLIIGLMATDFFRRFSTVVLFVVLMIGAVGVRVQSTYYFLEEFYWRDTIPTHNQGWRLN
ncbi:MAG: hypothetical protein Q4A37_01795 [Candidatus Saccharibacteria bacterium]|nr:hypothetical protein [Candidatus Saccharibacteria bacterium]